VSRSSQAMITFAAISMLCACQPEATNEDDAEDDFYALPVAQSAYLKASNTSPDAAFGHSLAFSGDTLVVGAFRETSAAMGVDGDPAGVPIQSGAAYVFRRTATGWQQEAYLKASSPDEYDEFGYGVAVSGDTVVVGAPREDSTAKGIGGDQEDDSGRDTGAVFVFDRSGATWRQTAYVKASNTYADPAIVPASDPLPPDGDFFGRSVAISGDMLAVGASGEKSAATGIDGDQNDTSAPGAGAVYVFRRAGSSWVQESYIKASDTRASASFGMSLAISDDLLAVGAMYAGDNGGGAAYLFRRSGPSWVQEASFQDATLVSNDLFGYDVALSGDTLVVGAIGFGNPGQVYVYRHTGTAWEQEALLQPPDAGVSAFGLSVALSGDTLAIGAIGGSDYGGSVYVYQRTGTEWKQEQLLRAPSSTPPDYFGSGVALGDGMLLVGSSDDDSAATGVGGDQTDASAPASGAVFVFD
jgi:hypothetical protein